MEIINPNEIGSKISTILYEAKQFVYLVSPWIHISRWEKFKINLEKAKARGVDIKFFIKEINEPEDFWLLKEFRIPVFVIDRLHTKLYLSENEAIITSMNLDERSYNRSIDIGLRCSKFEPEYSQIMNYYEDCIFQNAIRVRNSYLVPMTEIEEMHFDLKNYFPKDRINATDNYIYFYQVMPGIDASVYKESISLKSKGIVGAELNALVSKIKTSIGFDTVSNDTQNGYWFLSLYVPNNNSIITREIDEKLRQI